LSCRGIQTNPSDRARSGQLTAIGLSGATVPVREPPVLTDVALSARGQSVMKCGCTVVGHRRGFTGGRSASHRRLRGGTALVTVADMLGHARLDTVRLYTRPNAADRERALNLLPHDR
jgi:hypothetical protein